MQVKKKDVRNHKVNSPSTSVSRTLAKEKRCTSKGEPIKTTRRPPPPPTFMSHELQGHISFSGPIDPWWVTHTRVDPLQYSPRYRQSPTVQAVITLRMVFAADVHHSTDERVHASTDVAKTATHSAHPNQIHQMYLSEYVNYQFVRQSE